MTETFDLDGKRVPVTLIAAGPCAVTQAKTEKADGYKSVQIGYDRIAARRAGKNQAAKPYRDLKEFRVDDDGAFKANDEIKVEIFQEGDRVRISGLTKGKGFQGAVKKHGFKGRHSCTHGTKHELRNVGSVGMGGASIRKGRKMPGRMGGQRVTVRNAKVVAVDAKNNIMAVRGAVPGHKGTLLEIRG